MKRCCIRLISLVVLVAMICSCMSCSNSNNNENTDQTAHQHKYGDWMTIKEATCENEGKMARYCECGEKQEKIIETKGHTYDENGVCTVCGYTKSEEAMSSKKTTPTPTLTPTPTPTLTPTPTPMFQFNDQYVKVGNSITFGSYEQDNDTSNGKEAIEWRVLAIEDNKALLVSEYALECQMYNTELTDITWENCTLRTWLNGTFLNTSFSAAEQTNIQISTVVAENNPSFGTNAGKETKDKIFLLSISDAEKYFNSDDDRECIPTAYALAQRIGISNYTKMGKATTAWWLRSPGVCLNDASYVSNIGFVCFEGLDVYIGLGVRPALWISLSKSTTTPKSKATVTPIETPTAKATVIPTAPPTQMSMCKFNGQTVRVGNTITFGSYEQDNITLNGKEAIEWRVLAIEGSKALLISEYALDSQLYNATYTSISWENCTLRTWLNETFLNTAFSTAEQANIQSCKVTAEDNPIWGTKVGNDTIDKVFLLSISEANKYFSSDEDRKCVTTAYSIEQGIWTNDSHAKGGESICRWLLRSPGGCQNYVSFVEYAGFVFFTGYPVNSSNFGVRPALWISLES